MDGATVQSQASGARGVVFAAIGVFVGWCLVAVAVLDSGSGWGWLIQIAACVGLGWVARTWWVALLAPVPILLAVPFGYTDPDPGYEGDLLSAVEIMATPLNALFIALGVVIALRAAIRKSPVARANVRFAMACVAVAIIAAALGVLVSSLD